MSTRSEIVTRFFLLAALGACSSLSVAQTADVPAEPESNEAQVSEAPQEQAASDGLAEGTLLEAAVTSVVGAVQFKTNAEQAWQPIQVGMVLKEGTQVRTGLRSQLILQINGQKLTFSRNGLYTLTQLVRSMTESGEPQDSTRIEMERGVVGFSVREIEAKNDVKVRTPDAVLAVTGTDGFIGADANGTRAGGAEQNTGSFLVTTNSGSQQQVTTNAQVDTPQGGNALTSTTENRTIASRTLTLDNFGVESEEEISVAEKTIGGSSLDSEEVSRATEESEELGSPFGEDGPTEEDLEMLGASEDTFIPSDVDMRDPEDNRDDRDDRVNDDDRMQPDFGSLDELVEAIISLTFRELLTKSDFADLDAVGLDAESAAELLRTFLSQFDERLLRNLLEVLEELGADGFDEIFDDDFDEDLFGVDFDDDYIGLIEEDSEEDGSNSSFNILGFGVFASSQSGGTLVEVAEGTPNDVLAGLELPFVTDTLLTSESVSGYEAALGLRPSGTNTADLLAAISIPDEVGVDVRFFISAVSVVDSGNGQPTQVSFPPFVEIDVQELPGALTGLGSNGSTYVGVVPASENSFGQKSMVYQIDPLGGSVLITELFSVDYYAEITAVAGNPGDGTVFLVTSPDPFDSINPVLPETDQAGLSIVEYHPGAHALVNAWDDLQNLIGTGSSGFEVNSAASVDRVIAVGGVVAGEVEFGAAFDLALTRNTPGFVGSFETSPLGNDRDLALAGWDPSESSSGFFPTILPAGSVTSSFASGPDTRMSPGTQSLAYTSTILDNSEFVEEWLVNFNVAKSGLPFEVREQCRIALLNNPTIRSELNRLANMRGNIGLGSEVVRNIMPTVPDCNTNN